MDRTHVEYWPAHLRAVFAVVGRSMGDRPLDPDIARCVPGDCGSVVAGHSVTLCHVPGRRTGPRNGHYVVTVAGPRINARSRFAPFELERLSRSVAQALGRVAKPIDGEFGQGAEVW